MRGSFVEIDDAPPLTGSERVALLPRLWPVVTGLFAIPGRRIRTPVLCSIVMSWSRSWSRQSGRRRHGVLRAVSLLPNDRSKLRQ
jgi:hypothetical protein